MQITSTSMFEYNRRNKIKFILGSGLIALFLILVISFYLLFLKNLDIGFFNFFSTIAKHVEYNIGQATFLGIFYGSVVGGLFFVTLPTEILFIGFITKGTNPYIAVLFYIGGFIISHTINYVIGSKLKEASKKIITPQKFYKAKGLLNKYGGFGIFLVNVIPFLPSQPISTIVGVFNYNKHKFYVYLVLGLTIKFMAIAFLYGVIF